MEYTRPHRRTGTAVSLYLLTAAPLGAAITALLQRVPFLPTAVGRLFALLWAAATLWAVGVYLPLRYRRIRFCFGKEQLTSVSGVFFRTRRQMPLSAVRHVTVLRGPLERRWGFAHVLLSGAGGHLWLEGVDADEAAALSQRVTDGGRP